MEPLQTNHEIESTLQKLESGKWHPSSVGGFDGLIALYAEDFVTVEYGPNPFGDAARSTEGWKLLASESGRALAQMLDATEFVLSEWAFVHPAPGAVVVSYRVHAPALGWNAYATSIWARRDDGWRTVFYQASRTAGRAD